MNVTAINEAGLSVSLTYHELLIVCQALNEVCNGLRMPDFSKTIGVERVEANHLLESLMVFRDTQDTDTCITLTPRELRTLSKALKEVGDRLSPWEFPIRMGAQRTETDCLLADVLGALAAHPAASASIRASLGGTARG